MKHGNFNGIEDKIAAWERKYPLADFINPEIIRKIKAILNKDFLSRLMGDYLAAKVLHEREKQLEAYKSLEQIINSAKKTKDYKTALKEVKKWKETLGTNGLSIYNFDRYYRPKVCTLLLIPSKELKNQDEATQSLKELKDKGQSMDSKSYAQEISDWQSKYCVEKFPDKLQSELNTITAEVLKSISEKKDEETALEQLQDVISNNNGITAVDAIASILSQYDYTHFSDTSKQKINAITMKAMSISEDLLVKGFDIDDESSMLSKNSTTSIQFRALSDLKDIFSRNSHDLEGLLNWIYVNRKISFTQFARDEIVKQFVSAGYKIPTQASYYIPEINTSLTFQNFSKIDEIRKDVILNYLGIIAQGNTLSRAGKDNITKIHSTSEKESIISENVDSNTLMILPVYDNEQNLTSPEEDSLYDETGATSETKEDESVYNIVIEDLLEDPLETYEIPSVSKEQISTVAEENPVIQNIEGSSEKPVEVSMDNEIKKEVPTIQIPVYDTLVVTDTSSKDKLEEKTESALSSLSVETQEEQKTSSTYSSTIESQEEEEEELFTNSSDSQPDIYSLTLEDQNNIEQANNESTYVVVATPILEMALSHTATKFQAIKNIQKEDVPEKNNGF